VVAPELEWPPPASAANGWEKSKQLVEVDLQPGGSHSDAGLKPGETLTEGQRQAAQEPVRVSPGWNFLLNDWIVSCCLSPSEVDLADRT
jgi:hypothetical protein